MPPFRGLHQASIVTQEKHHCHRRETRFPHTCRLATVIGWRRRVQPRPPPVRGAHPAHFERPRTERDVLRGPAGAGLNPPPLTGYGCQSASVGNSCFPLTTVMSLSSSWTFLCNNACLVEATEWRRLCHMVNSWATCLVRAVEQFVATGTASGQDMTKGYLLPTISPESQEFSRLEDQGLFRRHR